MLVAVTAAEAGRGGMTNLETSKGSIFSYFALFHVFYLCRAGPDVGDDPEAGLKVGEIGGGHDGREQEEGGRGQGLEVKNEDSLSVTVLSSNVNLTTFSKLVKMKFVFFFGRRFKAIL